MSAQSNPFSKILPILAAFAYMVFSFSLDRGFDLIREQMSHTLDSKTFFENGILISLLFAMSTLTYAWGVVLKLKIIRFANIFCIALGLGPILYPFVLPWFPPVFLAAVRSSLIHSSLSAPTPRTYIIIASTIVILINIASFFSKRD